MSRLLNRLRLHLPWFLRRTSSCQHAEQLAEPVPTPRTRGECEECIQMGDTWHHLRACLSCGTVGCCDQSKNKHATAHFRATGHPVVQSHQPGESWRWCYVDEVMLRP